MTRPLMDESLYRECADGFPDAELFGDLSVVGHKYSLSEKSNRRGLLIRVDPFKAFYPRAVLRHFAFMVCRIMEHG